MGSMDEQSLFDSYDNQKVPSGKPPKLSDEPWKKRPLDPDFDDFHIPPKRTALFEEAKPDIHDNVDDKRVIVPAGKRRPPVTPDGDDFFYSFILSFCVPHKSPDHRIIQPGFTFSGLFSVLLPIHGVRRI